MKIFLTIAPLLVASSTTITLSNQTLPIKVEALCAAVYNGTYSILHGHGKNQQTTTHFTSSYTSNDRWKTWIQHININNPFNPERIYYDGQQCTQTIGSYLLYSVPRIYVGSTWYNGEYLFIFDLQQQSFQNTASYNALLPQRAQGSCLMIVDGILFVIAGWDKVADQWLATTQIYNISKDEWAQKTLLQQKRSHHGCAMDENTAEFIYVFGGWDGPALNILDSIEKYSISNDLWIKIDETLSRAIENLECRYFLSYIFCFGGLSDAILPLSIIEVFDPYTESILNWNIALNEPKAWHTSITSNDAVIIMGGRDLDSIDLDSIEILKESDFPFTPSPTSNPSNVPSQFPTDFPSDPPSISPSIPPSNAPTSSPSNVPFHTPTTAPSDAPTSSPTMTPTPSPSNAPTKEPSSWQQKEAPVVISSTVEASIANQHKNNDNDDWMMLLIIICCCFIISMFIIIVSVFLVIYYRKQRNNKRNQDIVSIGHDSNVNQMVTPNSNMNNDDKINDIEMVEVENIGGAGIYNYDDDESGDDLYSDDHEHPTEGNMNGTKGFTAGNEQSQHTNNGDMDEPILQTNTETHHTTIAEIGFQSFHKDTSL